MSDITFVTVGKLAGKTVNLGVDGKYRFVNGQCRVPDEIAGLVATALRFYCAFPMGDAWPYHVAACEKAGLIPEDNLPSGVTPPKAKESAKKKPPEPVSEEVLMERVGEVINKLDPADDEHWTKSGYPSINWVRDQLDDNVAPQVSRAVLDSFGVMRPV